MSAAAANTFFQLPGVSAVFQHGFIVVAFQETGMTLAEIMNHPVAGTTDVGENADTHSFKSNHEAVRISCVVVLGKRNDRQTADRNTLVGGERAQQFIFYTDAGMPVRNGCDINR